MNPVPHSGSFRKGDPRTREAARKGGLVKAARRRRLEGPFDGSILDVMDVAGLTGPSWAPWRAFWRAVFALPMEEETLVSVYPLHGRAALVILSVWEFTSLSVGPAGRLF